jgi:hypothetical protein
MPFFAGCKSTRLIVERSAYIVEVVAKKSVEEGFSEVIITRNH